MKWLLLFLWNPAEAFDWYDMRQSPPRIDHGKVVPDLLVQALTALILWLGFVRQEWPPIAWGILLLSAAFGRSMFTRFLSRATINVSDASVHTLTEQVHGGSSADFKA